MATAHAYAATDLLTVARATKGWSFSAAGVLTEASANGLRIDFDPVTLAYRGLLIEAPVTYPLPNPRGEGASPSFPTGWTSTSVAGMTWSVPARGTEDGIDTVDFRWAGTPTVTNQGSIRPAGLINVAGLQGETFWAGVNARVVAGSLTNIDFVRLNILEITSGGGIAAQDGAAGLVFAPTGAPLREQAFTKYRTFTAATAAFAAFAIEARATSGMPIDVTLRLGLPRLIKTPFPVSMAYPAVGATGPFVRAGDDVSFTDVGRWFNPRAGTFAIDFMPRDAAGVADRDILMLDNGTSAERVRLRMLPGDTSLRLAATVGGVGVATLNQASGAVLTRHTARFSYGPAGYFLSVNGAAPVSAAAACPAGMERVLLGNSGGANHFNGWFGPRIAYWPEQFTDVAGRDGFTIRDR